jgi:hypothetical protein
MLPASPPSSGHKMNLIDASIRKMIQLANEIQLGVAQADSHTSWIFIIYTQP